MCDPVTIGLGISAIAAGASIHQGEQARKASNTAADQAKNQADQAYNKANQKKPNAAAMLYDNQQASLNGVGGTTLTGPQGAAPAPGMLGKQTLLGG